MTADLPPDGYGRAEVVPVKLLPVWEVDCGGTAGGRAETAAVVMLPIFMFDVGPDKPDAPAD
jgi:hypothetical protein